MARRVLAPQKRRSLDPPRGRRAPPRENPLRTALRLAPIAVWALDRDGIITLSEGGVLASLGLEPGELVGRSIFELYHDHPAILSHSTRALAGETFSAIVDLGSLSFEARYTPLRGSRGEIIGTIGVATGAVERKRAEEALRASEERFSKAFHASPAAMSISSLSEGRYLYVNDSFLRLFGYAEEEVIGKTALDLSFWGSAEDREAAVRLLREQGSVRNLEVSLRTKSGQPRSVLVSLEMVELDGQACLLGLSHDVTERKSLEDQLRQSQKIEAVGRLAGGIAHDFNNLLTAILGYSNLLLARLGESHPLHRNVDEIRKAGERAASLTRQLLAFSRKQVLVPEILDLNALIADLNTMLRRLIGEDIDLVTVPDPELGKVRADPGQIEQVIVNLVVNSRDAMPKGGRLTIEVGNADLDASFVQQHVGGKPGPHVMFAISDTGIGMDAETRRHIFEPFFTTKEKGKGTGLGLATVYGIVKQSGGYISVYSEPGHGTTFKVYLPRVETPIEPAADRSAAPSSPRGSETVLLVEDEKAVRDLAREILEDSGYRVIEGMNGAHALQLSEALPTMIHVLLTDVVMPDMGGPELAQRLVDVHPETRVLYMSGYTDEAIVHRGVLEPGTAFLHKPFTADALARKVREVLDRSDLAVRSRDAGG